MGKTRIIAETGAGQHGVASATVAARFGLQCVVYMGATDIERQKINVYRMKLLGAEVVPVTSGSATLKDALNEAMRDWVTNVAGTFYIIGTVAGPDPYPRMVRDFNAVVGREARAQVLAEYGLPDAVTACVGGGSNAIGIFHAFLNDAPVRIVGAEAAGEGIASGRHAASLAAGRPGVLHGNRTYVLCDDDGQIVETHSVSPASGLSGRRSRARVPQGHGPRRIRRRDRRRGAGRVPPAGEDRGHPARARIQPRHRPGVKLARDLPRDGIVLCNLSGRGDKDVHTIAARRDATLIPSRFRGGLGMGMVLSSSPRHHPHPGVPRSGKGKSTPPNP